MRIIVVGAGEVGTYIADRLSKQEHDIALIDLDPERHRQIDAELDVLAIKGSGTDFSILQKAGIEETDLLVAATNKDEINLLSALLARQAGVNKTIVRVESRKLRSKEVESLFEKFDDHLVIDPDQEVADSVLRLMEYPGAMDLSRMANEEVVIIGARLPAHAPLVGVSLHALGRELDPDWDFIVGTITRKDENDDSEEITIVPRQDEVLKEGDLLRVICKSRAMHDVTNRLGIARDVPIILNSVSYEDNYRGEFGERRAIIYTLGFTTKFYLYGPVTSQKVIKTVQVDQYTNLEDTAPKREQRYTVTPKPFTADADDDFGFNETTSFFQDAKEFDPVSGTDK